MGLRPYSASYQLRMWTLTLLYVHRCGLYFFCYAGLSTVFRQQVFDEYRIVQFMHIKIHHYEKDYHVIDGKVLLQVLDISDTPKISESNRCIEKWKCQQYTMRKHFIILIYQNIHGVHILVHIRLHNSSLTISLEFLFVLNRSIVGDPHHLHNSKYSCIFNIIQWINAFPSR